MTLCLPPRTAIPQNKNQQIKRAFQRTVSLTKGDTAAGSQTRNSALFTLNPYKGRCRRGAFPSKFGTFPNFDCGNMAKNSQTSVPDFSTPSYFQILAWKSKNCIFRAASRRSAGLQICKFGKEIAPRLTALTHNLASHTRHTKHAPNMRKSRSSGGSFPRSRRRGLHVCDAAARRQAPTQPALDSSSAQASAFSSPRDVHATVFRAVNGTGVRGDRNVRDAVRRKGRGLYIPNWQLSYD